MILIIMYSNSDRSSNTYINSRSRLASARSVAAKRHDDR